MALRWIILGVLALGAVERSGIDLAAIDKTCEPCSDFFQYANGIWVEKNAIPAKYTSWGKRQQITDQQREGLRAILEDAVKNREKIGTFYETCMDESTIEKQDLEPVRPELDRIANIADRRDLMASLARLHRIGIFAPFGLASGPDRKDPNQVIAILGTGGLGLPDRDYYFKDDEKTVRIREAYVKHVARMLELAGREAEPARVAAAQIVQFETRLAAARLTRVDLRDPYKTYNKMPVSGLDTLAPNIMWAEYLTALGAPKVSELNVSQPKAIQTVNAMVNEQPLEHWKAYLTWNLVNVLAPGLPKRFVEEEFAFTSVLRGVKEQQPRWQRCVAATDEYLGEALGQAYVKKYFPPEAKRRVQEMVANLRAALNETIRQAPWFEDATRSQALAKLEAFAVKVGYPDKWRDYSRLEVKPGPYVNNLLAARRFEVERFFLKIGQPLDRTEWSMTPPTNNAYYSPPRNEIVFPAGILQYPMFQTDADDAVNYGAIGSVIGHEISHGFDDQGSRYDAGGALRDWWTPGDRKRFEDRAQCIIDQFEGTFIEPGVHHTGKLVVGEAIGDLGGAKIAWLAWQKSLQGKSKPPVVEGFTPEQRFFVGFAQARTSVLRPEYARLLVNTDPHPINRFRVNGTLANMPEFAAAFRCKRGDAMVREQQCRVW